MTSIALFAGLLTIGVFFSVGYLSEREPALKWLVIAVLALVDVGFELLGIPLAMAESMAVLTGRPIMPAPQAAPAPTDAGAAAAQAMVQSMATPAAERAFLVMGVSMVVLGIIGLLLLLRPIRRLVARIIPIDPDRVVHTIALHLVLLLVAVSVMVAAFLPVMAASEAQLTELSRATAEGGLSALWAQAFGFAALALLGVGLFIGRDWRAALARLGLTRRFSVPWWLGATLLGLAGSFAMNLVWSHVDPVSFEKVGRLGDAMFGPYLKYGILGALTIGLSAGLGEELLFRGAAQPRLGLILTSLLFMVIHTQYTVSLALLQMLYMGLLLGIVRMRVNTTTSIGVHAAYNFVLVMLAIYAPNLGP